MAPTSTLAFILAISVLALCPWSISGEGNEGEGNVVAEDSGPLEEVPKVVSNMVVEMSLGEDDEDDDAAKKRSARDVQSLPPGLPEGTQGRSAAMPISYTSSSSYSMYSNDDCYVNGGIIRHGNTAAITGSNPCWTAQCWYGNLYDREDGCYVEGRCYDVNREFSKDCVTYYCSKTQQGSNSYRYSVTSSRVDCSDAYGGCRTSGESYPATINGVYRNNCRCLGNGLTVCYS